jgi:predicted permease
MSTIRLLIPAGLSQAVRALWRHPGFTTAAVLTLALGLGATTAIFSVVYGVLIKPLPYRDAHELVSIRHTAPGLMRTAGQALDNALGVAETMYVTYREENQVFEHLALYTGSRQTLTGSGETEQVQVLAISDGMLQALGGQPALGRSFTAAEYTLEADAAAPVIVSYAFWQRRLGGDESALGRTISLELRDLQVVGVMPAGFRFLDLTPQPDVISPIRTDGSQMMIWSTGRAPNTLALSHLNHAMLARLKDGVTLEGANADVARLLPIWLDAWPERSGGLSRAAVADWQLAPAVIPLKDQVIGNVAGKLWLLLGAVGAVLLIACANIANLLLARADARRQELAIRSVLGAGRRRIAADLLRESFVLGMLGGAGGLALAYVGLELLAAFAPANLPRVEDIVVGAPVLAFAVAMALVSSLAFGAVPALKHAFAADSPLGAGAHGATATRQGNRTRSALIVVQVALALVLLVGAGLMIRTFQALVAVDPGFRDPAEIQVASIFIPFPVMPESERYTRVYREALERIAALPGVTAAGFGCDTLGSAGGQKSAISVEDRPEPEGGSPPTRRFMSASPGCFEALGTRLVAGRHLAWPDIEETRAVVLVSENLARELWGEPQTAIGKRVRWQARGAPDPWHEIVGVTQDVPADGLHAPPPPVVFRPLITEGSDLRGVTYMIRSDRTGTESFVNEVRQAVWQSHPDIVVTIQTMQNIYSAALATTSFILVLLAIASAMALLLSAVGVYGVISYVVSQRTREIGIRLALGAGPSAVKRMFILYGLAVATIGVATGLGAAAAFSQLLTSLLFEVRPLDPATYVAVVTVLLLAVSLAAYLPARRAARLDPMETLRAE